MRISRSVARLCLIFGIGAAHTLAGASGLTLSPLTIQLIPGASITFATTWSGVTASPLNWTVTSSSSSPIGLLGTVTGSGTYTAPPSPPSPNVVIVKAIDSADSTIVGVATVTISSTAPPYVTLSPDGRTIRCGASLTLAAKALNTTDQTFVWQVNGIAGGNSSLGTVTSAGVYTAPLALPSSPAVTITAVSHANSASKASVTVNLQNPQPVVTSVGPNPVITGNTTLTITGSGFAQGATVYFAGYTLPTTFVSSTQLTATGSIAMPLGRLAAVKVVNPNPGTLTSTPVSVPVRVAKELMPYTDAVRFLEMATFGPTPTSVAELQTLGRDAWLAAQFAKPASTWPDPLDPTENVTRLQTSFFNIALNSDDQLRQRVSFALAQIMVASAVKDIRFDQMVGYQRIMGDNAFGKFRDLLTNITLSPAMGYFLDMVNNAKANPSAGTVANENYAREVMQLFTLGLVQLNPDGTQILRNGATVPEYDQSTVTQMAKVMTGWTYAPEPGYASHWGNQAYYFAPMVPFDTYHDQTEKDLNLPIPCTIGAGGTTVNDMNAALDCIYKQTNVAPFIAYRLIQRLVMSNPSTAYVSRVSNAFTTSGGDLQATVTAVLTDTEALTEGSGKLNEPVLYATQVLRAIDAATASADGLATQTNNMGQNVLTAGSVFSYFSPFFRIPDMTPPPVAPEFQAMNASTALARANFVYKAITNGISGNIQVNLANLQDLANNPADLVEAVNQALYRGEMDSNVRSILTTAANGSTNTLTRVRSVLYAAAAAPQYEVEQ